MKKLNMSKLYDRETVTLCLLTTVHVNNTNVSPMHYDHLQVIFFFIYKEEKLRACE